MSQAATVFGASAPDRLAHLIQKRIFGDQVDIPLEISLWGGCTYRFWRRRRLPGRSGATH